MSNLYCQITIWATLRQDLKEATRGVVDAEPGSGLVAQQLLFFCLYLLPQFFKISKAHIFYCGCRSLLFGCAWSVVSKEQVDGRAVVVMHA